MQYRVTSILIYAIGVMVALASGALASGYHPEFDQAVKEAKIIVAGRVTKAWSPESRKNKQDYFGYTKGEVYRMKIREVFKGDVKPGDEIVFWDPYSGSTASYCVEEGKPNLTFLVDASPDPEDLEKYDYGADLKYAPISNSTTGIDWSLDEYWGWLWLLNMVLRGSPKNDVSTYRTLLPTQKNRYVLNYIVEHWPKDMSKEDERLFRTALGKHRDDPYITSPILERLSKAKKTFSTEELVDLLKTSDALSREKLLRHVNAGNIVACRDILFGWISQDEGWLDSTEVLANLAPGYLKSQLRKRDLPFWVAIPCLQELHINGRAIGKRDYPAGVLKSNPYTLRFIGDVIKGKGYWAVSAMEAPEQNDDWRQTFPLLDNIIAGKDSPARRQFVALMRTFGENVRRSGAGYKRIPGGAVPKCPIRIELAAQRGAYKLGTPIRITVKEIGQVNGAWICFNGEIEESLEGPIGIMYTGGGGSEDFANTRAPKRDFTKLKKGSVHTFTDDPSFSIERAGVYKVSLKKTYTHDGASVGLDAWTGVAFSEPVQITVIK